jgi:transcriptional regulator of acetoin/glycerol metabolism
MPPRPYNQLDIEELEALFKSSKRALEQLTAMNQELKRRHSKRARSLRTKVNQWIAEQEQKVKVQEDLDKVFLTLDELKKRHVIRALKKTKGIKSKAAKILGINRKTLFRMVERFGFER